LGEVTPVSGTERRAGAVSDARGTAYLTAAKLWFLATGAFLPILLARILPPDRYGVYKVVTGAMTIVNALLVTGAVQSVSKFVAEDLARADEVHRKALILQAGLGVGAAAFFALAAPLVAAALRDPGLVALLRLAALAIATFGLYAVFMGTMNGRRHFGKQAALDFTYSTAKVALILGLAWTAGVAGALVGFASAGLLVGLLGLAFAGTGAPGHGFPMRRLFGFAAGAMSVTLVVNLLLQTDLFLVKRLSAAGASNLQAGLYSVAMDLSRLPYQALAVPVALVLLPAVSRGVALGEPAAAAAALRGALRYVLIGVGLCATILAANALPLLLLVFKPGYALAAVPLRIAPFGMLAFCVYYLMSTALIGSGRPFLAAAIGAVTLAVDVALNALLIPRHGLLGAAAATCGALAIGAVLSAVVIRSILHASLPLTTLARVAIAAAATAAASSLWPVTGPVVLIKGGILTALFGGALLVLREIGREDFDRFRAIFRVAG
jgi:O-antigen/teichoic acid export membrane protein